MKLAVPIEPETGMVAEHFGHAKHIKLYDEVMGVVFTDMVESPANGHEGVCAFLEEAGVQCVLCMNLGEGARDALFEHNIGVFAGVSGPADELVVALLENRLRYTTEATCHHQGEGGCACGCDCGEDCCGDDGSGCGC